MIFVGVTYSNKRVIVTSTFTPTFKTHGNRYACMIGPFQTWDGAEFMARFGAGNPHCQTVAEAEILAQKHWEMLP